MSGKENEKIRQATVADLDEIWALFRKAIADLQRHHINQWDDMYPDLVILADDVAKKQMYVLTLDDQIVAAIVLNEEQNEAYCAADWSDKEGNAAVIHRLCVHPDYQSRGIGRKMVFAAEEHLAAAGYKSIRLDAFVGNNKALKLYAHLGYSLRGSAEFSKGVFGLYEKRLDIERMHTDDGIKQILAL